MWIVEKSNENIGLQKTFDSPRSLRALGYSVIDFMSRNRKLGLLKEGKRKRKIRTIFYSRDTSFLDEVLNQAEISEQEVSLGACQFLAFQRRVKYIRRLSLYFKYQIEIRNDYDVQIFLFFCILAAA